MGRITVRRIVRRRAVRQTAAPRLAQAGPSQGSREKIRTLIGCSDPQLAARLVGALSGSSNVEAVGIAGTPAEAAEKAKALRPDVVVFDVDLGGEMRGLEAGLALRKSPKAPGVVMIAPDNDPGCLKGRSAGMGSEWSCLFTETAVQPGGLAYAAQCAAWAVPVVDPKLDWAARDARRTPRPAARPDLRPAPASDSYQDGWRGALRTVSVSETGGPPARL